MFRFGSPEYLWVLSVLPILILIRYTLLYRRKRKLQKIGDAELLRSLMPDVSSGRRALKFWLLMVVVFLMIIMLARPQMGSKVSTDKRNGIETIICLDISNSMLAGDVVPSRLDKAKMLVENLIDKFNNDKIGLVVFAGEAFVQLPITSDYVSAKMFLQGINTSLITTQGTDVARAISLASSSFTQQPNVGRAIVLITDGEDHEGGAEQAAAAAKKKGINVFILGIGSTKGAPIPVGGGNYLKDQSGNVVMTALNEDMCRKVAKAGSGIYIHVDNTNDAQERLNDELSKLQKGETQSVVYSEYAEQFQAFALIILVLLIAEICVLEVRSARFRNVRLFKKPLTKRYMLIITMLFAAIGMQAQADRQFIRSGNRFYRQQNYAKAEAEYRKALSVNADNPQAYYNLGCALMMQNKDSVAIEQYEKAGKIEKSNMRRAKVYHNIGVICQNHKMYAEAIEAYKESLRCNPSDNATRYNLALCKRLKKDNKDKQQQKQKDKQQKQQKNKQQKKKQDKQQDKQQQQQQQQEKMSKDNAQQLLNAAMQQEQSTRQKVNNAMHNNQSRRLQKNW